MKSNSTISPPKFIESNEILWIVDEVSIVETVVESTEEGGEPTFSYTYDMYELTLTKRSDLAEYIEANYEFLLQWAKDKSLKSAKDLKLTQINQSAQSALKTFTFSDLTFELSGESKSNLIFVQSQMSTNPLFSTPWFALDGTYGLGDTDHILLDASNIADFAKAMEDRTNAVFAWKETQKYFLGMAQTIEAVKAISTDYPQ
jgi:hypothetical protein